MGKSLREIAPVTLGFGLMIVVVETVIAFILPQVQSNMLTMILRLDFARNLLGALLGTPVTGDMSVQLLQAIPWVHPLVLLIVFGHETTICTRLPAAEIDRGTIDLLLGLPVSRWQVYVCQSLVWAASGLLLLLLGLAGNWLGARLGHSEMAPAERLGIAIGNAFCLYLAIGCFALLVSACSERRGRAIGVIFTMIVGSFLINFLAGFWKPAKSIDFLSVLSYYRPFFILQDGSWPWADIRVLLAAAAVFWTAGGVVFQRRDIHTL